MALSFWQVLLVVVLFLLLFGRGKIPQLMGDLAEGIRSFRKGVSDVSGTPNTANAEQKTERVDEQKQA